MTLFFHLLIVGFVLIWLVRSAFIWQRVAKDNNRAFSAVFEHFYQKRDCFGKIRSSSTVKCGDPKFNPLISAVLV